MVACDNLVGVMGWKVGGRLKREGTYIYIWLIHVDVWQKPTQQCKAIILQLKINKFLKREKKTISGGTNREFFTDVKSLNFEKAFDFYKEPKSTQRQGKEINGVTYQWR